MNTFKCDKENNTSECILTNACYDNPTTYAQDILQIPNLYLTIQSFFTFKYITKTT